MHLFDYSVFTLLFIITGELINIALFKDDSSIRISFYRQTTVKVANLTLVSSLDPVSDSNPFAFKDNVETSEEGILDAFQDQIFIKPSSKQPGKKKIKVNSKKNTCKSTHSKQVTDLTKALCKSENSKEIPEHSHNTRHKSSIKREIIEAEIGNHYDNDTTYVSILNIIRLSCLIFFLWNTLFSIKKVEYV